MKREYTQQDMLDFANECRGLSIDQEPSPLITIEDFNEWKETRPKKVSKEMPVPWIKQWMDLWPVGVKSGGKYIRSDEASCLKKMSKFVKDNPNFDRGIILEATRQYLKEREEADWTYTRCAIYFIDKQGAGSELAVWCNELKEDLEKALDMGEVEEHHYPRTHDI